MEWIKTEWDQRPSGNCPSGRLPKRAGAFQIGWLEPVIRVAIAKKGALLTIELKTPKAVHPKIAGGDGRVIGSVMLRTCDDGPFVQKDLATLPPLSSFHPLKA